MNRKVYYFIVIAYCLAQPFLSYAQPKERLARFEDGKFVMTLDKRWNPDMLKRTIDQYGLDSATVAAVFAEEALPPVPKGTEQWQVTKVGADRFEISKSLEGYVDANGWKTTWIADPRAKSNMQGPGYVDQSKVTFGYNQTDNRTTLEFAGRAVKISTSDFKDADQLSITGSFNDWDTRGIPGKKVGNNWVFELRLEPGKYLYKYISDGRWSEDRGNKQHEYDGFGGKNAVLYMPNHRFKFNGYANAKQGVVSGSFNGWNEKQVQMEKNGSSWYADVYLKEGTYTYKFRMDKSWMPDPNNGQRVPDGLGGMNTVLSLGTPTLFRLEGFENARQVVLSGDFNGWQESELQMEKTPKGWELPYVLGKGNYAYKFLVDGEWMTDPSNPLTVKSGEYTNSFISKGANHTFTCKPGESVTQVVVTGSFNGWDTNNFAMFKLDGEWKFSLFLPPGKHRYKFIVDGSWFADPDNPLYEDNGYGTSNSVLWIDDQVLEKP